MRIPHLFLPPEQFSSNAATILGQDHTHLTKVLRARIGSSVVLLDNLGSAYSCTIDSIDRHSCKASIQSRLNLDTELRTDIVVAQAIGKGSKFEEVIQHGTEIGAKQFWPILSDYCQVDISDTNVVKKLERWRHISTSAAEQSHRLFIPLVTVPMSFDALIASITSESSPALMLHPSPMLPMLQSSVRDISTAGLVVMIGPEGGWSEREVHLAHESGVNVVQMGPRVMRTETAGLAAISTILALRENA